MAGGKEKRKEASRGKRRPARVCLRSRRGSAMVEAAIILPLVIAAVMVILYILINLYSAVSLQSVLHISLRHAAAEETGLTEIRLTDAYARDRYRSRMETLRPEIQRQMTWSGSFLKAVESRVYHGNAMVRTPVRRPAFGSWWLIDEPAAVGSHAS